MSCLYNTRGQDLPAKTNGLAAFSVGQRHTGKETRYALSLQHDIRHEKGKQTLKSAKYVKNKTGEQNDVFLRYLRSLKPRYPYPI